MISHFEKWYQTYRKMFGKLDVKEANKRYERIRRVLEKEIMVAKSERRRNLLMDQLDALREAFDDTFLC